MNFNFWRKQNTEKELDEELAGHLEMAAHERVERGEAADAAQYSSRREFGNVELVKETARDVWGREWLHRMWLDVRVSLRSLARSPGFCAVAVATLALGIGANTAIFSVIHEVLLAPLPFRDSSAIVQVYTSNEAFKGFHLGVALGDVSEIEKAIPELAELTVYDSLSKGLTGNGKPQKLETTLVTNNFFQFLGTAPQFGRFFTEEEHHPGHESVVVLSNSLWRSRFGSDSLILGKRIRLDGKDYTVIGVTRPEFNFPSKDLAVWIPLAPTLKESQDHNDHRHELLAHLRKGARLEQTNRGLLALSLRIEKENKNGFGGWRMSAVNLQQWTVEDVKPALLLLFGAVLLVLLIACANFANLLLARGWQRHKEMAVRTALGASRWRIARLLLTESVFLAVGGGAVGLILAAWAVATFRQLAPPDTPRLDQLHPDWTMTGFALLCALIVGVVFGVLPALQAARWEPNVALKGAATIADPVRRKLRDSVAMLEITLALPLLVGAGLLGKGFSAMVHTAPGYRLDHILLMSIDLPESKYAKNAQQSAFARQVLENVRGVPGVESAAMANSYPLSGRVALAGGLHIQGDADSSQGLGNIQTDSVSDGYFETLGVPILRGRAFTTQDSESSVPVALVNEAMARKAWKSRDPIGQRISTGHGPDAPPVLIVGIAADTRDISLNTAPRAKLYYPIAQDPWANLHLIVRTNREATTLAPTLQQRIWDVDKDQPIEEVQTIETAVAESVAAPRFLMILLSTFAFLGATLALIGIYGVVSYTVSQRTKEIGVRVAIGAEKKNVLRLVIGHGLRIALSGIAIGLAAALLLAKLLSAQLYGVSAHDPLIFFGVSLMLAAAVVLACYVPARRAMKVDPLVALHYE